MSSSMFLSVLLAGNVKLVRGYAFSQPRTKPLTSALSFPEIGLQFPSEVKVRKVPADIETAFLKRNKPPRNTYDLGLGKNKPVKSEAVSVSNDVHVADALMHWNEYESVREFPSPLKRVEVEYETPAASTKTTRRITSVNPTRYVEDSLQIIRNRKEDVAAIKDQPVMMRSDSSRMDVNTVWVEMLIHSEQLKVATATIN